MREPNDWRLTNQLSYLKGVEMTWRKYEAPRPDWDHDHCEFCWAKFADRSEPEILSEGFVTSEEQWVCASCYEDFNDLFEWVQSTHTAP